MTSYVINNFWFIANYLLVSRLYGCFIPERKTGIRWMLIVFIIGTIISFFFFGILEVNPFLNVYSSTIFITLSLLTYKSILEKGPMESQFRYPVFWIVTGIFLFHSATIFKGFVANYLIFDLQISSTKYFPISLFTLIFNTLKNLMFFFSFVLIKKGYPDYVEAPQKTL